MLIRLWLCATGLIAGIATVENVAIACSLCTIAGSLIVVVSVMSCYYYAAHHPSQSPTTPISPSSSSNAHPPL